MTEVSVNEFRENLEHYAAKVREEDIIVLSEGKPIMRITDPYRYRVEKVLSLRGIAKTEKKYESILHEKAGELADCQ